MSEATRKQLIEACEEYLKFTDQIVDQYKDVAAKIDNLNGDTYCTDVWNNLFSKEV